MAVHELDDGQPIVGLDQDITDADARYAFFESVAEEMMNNLRIERNKLLAETDFYALNDVTMSDEMRNYRQLLRDITDNYTSLHDVVWPEKPL